MNVIRPLFSVDLFDVYVLCHCKVVERTTVIVGAEQSLCHCEVVERTKVYYDGGTTSMSLRGSGTEEAISGVGGREIASLPQFG